MPQTETGIPCTGNAISVSDISAYDDSDNIIDGPVNPHSINLTDYIVAPGTTESETVTSNLILHTAFAGAKVQLETDNPESQIIWASSNKNVATVTQDGLVTFLTKGTVTTQARNDKAIAHIKFDPKEFFVFSTVNMNWFNAKEWCESQGYKQPPSNLLSTKANSRQIPSDAIWQEWGNVKLQDAVMGSSVVWSSTEWATEDNAYYMFFSDGQVTSNNEGATEGVICVDE